LITPQGEEILKLLAAEFDGSCYAKGDPHHTAYLEGKRDVVTYLREVKDNARPASIRNTRSSTGSIPRKRSTRSGSTSSVPGAGGTD
jgi:hypothetical protein